MEASSTHQTLQAPDDTRVTGFFALPRELRDQIYALIGTQIRTRQTCDPGATRWTASVPAARLLRISKQFSREYREDVQRRPRQVTVMRGWHPHLKTTSMRGLGVWLRSFPTVRVHLEPSTGDGGRHDRPWLLGRLRGDRSFVDTLTRLLVFLTTLPGEWRLLQLPRVAIRIDVPHACDCLAEDVARHLTEAWSDIARLRALRVYRAQPDPELWLQWSRSSDKVERVQAA